MTVSTAQYVDLLVKKLDGVAKTDTAANKSPSNESIPSPMLNRGDTCWTQAYLIPAVAAATAGIVQAYTGTDAVQCTADTTTVPVGGVYPTWLTNLTNWIPSEFGSTYFIKAYVDNPGAANPQTTGTQIFDSGIAGTGEWFFDYQAGLLNFIGQTIPAVLTSAKKVYIVGYRYVGLTGVQNLGNITVGNIFTDGYYYANGTPFSGGGGGSYTYANVSTYLASGNNIAGYSTTGNINVANITATGNITGAYILGNGSQLTGLPEQYGNANVAAYLASGNVATDIITTANVTAANVNATISYANTAVLGTATVPVATTQWVTANTSSTANIVLFEVADTAVSSLDIYIVATIPSFLSRQVTKLMSVNMSGAFNYNEYGSLSIGVPAADFTMGVANGNVQLYVTPSSNYATEYKIVVTQYSA